jgi:hypothetical protein
MNALHDTKPLFAINGTPVCVRPAMLADVLGLLGVCI